MSGNKGDEDDEYSYALDGNVDIFDSLFDSNDGKDASERKDLGEDSDEDDYSFSFDVHKKSRGRKNTKKKTKKEEDRKHQVSSSSSYSVRSTHQDLKRKKSLDFASDEKKTKRRRTSKNTVIIDDDTDDDIFSDDYKNPSSKKGKERKNKKSGKKKMTSGDVIEIDSSSDSEISDYEVEDEDDERTNTFSKRDVYSCDTEDDDDDERDNEEGGNNEATTFRTMSKTLKDIDNLTKKLKDDDDDIYEDDDQDILEEVSMNDDIEDMERRKANTPIILNVAMIGKSEPFKFRILRKDHFSKVLGFISKVVNIPSDKLSLKWGAIILDSNETPNKYVLEDYETLSLVIKDIEDSSNLTEKDADTEPLYGSTQSSLDTDTAGLDTLPDTTTNDDDGNKVILKLTAPSAGDFSVRISLKKTVQVLITGAAQHYKVPQEKIELQFDGEKMNPSTALSDFGLEDEDQIDVVFHK